MPVLRVAKNIRNALSSMLIMVMVAACGGSGPAGAPVAGSPNTGGGTDTTPTNDNVITLSWEDGSTENAVEDIMPRTLNITLKDDAGAAVVNEIVEVTTSLGALFPSSGRVATNSAGVASIQVDVTGAENGEAGAINVIQTDPNNGASVSSRLTISAISSATSVEDANVVSLAWADGNASNIISDTASRTLQITLTDSQGSPLDGELLSVVTTLGLLSPSSGSVATNSAGVASIDIDISGAENNEAGVLFVTHTDTVSQQQVEKNLTITASVTGSGASNAISVALGDNNFEVVDTSPENVTVNLKDSAGINLPNQVVTVSTTLGALSPSSGIVTTDVNGNAVVQLDVSGAEDKEGGTLVARHTDSDGDTVSANVNFSASITQAGDANVLTITMGDADFTIVDTTPELVTINLKDSNGDDLENEIIEISSSLGVLSPSSGKVTTNQNGNALIVLDVTGTEDNAAGTLTAKHTGGSGESVTKSINFSTDVTYTDLSDILMFEFADDNVTVSDTVSEVVNLTLTDYKGDPLTGKEVIVTTSNGTLIPAGGVLITDAAGEATFSLDVSGGTEGIGAIIANYSEGGLSKSISYNAIITQKDFNMALSFADGDVIVENTQDETVNFTLTDSAGNAVSGAEVILTSSNGSVSPIGGVVITDAFGQGSVDLDVSSGFSGLGVLTASYADGGASKSISYNVLVNEYDLSLAVTNYGNTGRDIDDNKPALIQATLLDLNGDPLGDQALSVATTIGMLSPSNGNIKTDASTGIASLYLDVTGVENNETGIVTVTYIDPFGVETSQSIVVSANILSPVDANTLSVSFAAPYNATTVIQDTTPATVNISLTDVAGKGLANELVYLYSSDWLGSLDPCAPLTNGAVLPTGLPSDGLANPPCVINTNDTGTGVFTLDVSGGVDGLGGYITAYHVDLQGNIVSKTLNFSASISPSNTVSGYSLVSEFYAVTILNETSNGAADSLTEFNGTLASLTAARPTEQGVTVNAVQESIYAVRVTNSDGDPIDGAIVNVTSTVGGISPASGQVLTNSNGVAYVTVDAGTADPGAAGTLTAFVSDASVSDNFAIGSVTLEIGYYGAEPYVDLDASNTYTVGDTFTDLNGNSTYDSTVFISGTIGVNVATLGTTNLSPAGTASLQVGVVDANGDLFTTPLTINFSSSCSSSGFANIDTGVTTVNGIATATYEADGCATTDTITASVVELSDVDATGSLTVSDAAANSIRFVSASPTNVALKGTGGTGRQEFSTLIFEVLDEAGQPKESEPVSVKLSTVIGGVNLTGDLDDNGVLENDERLFTNASGQVSVIVNAGTVPTPVRVEASIEVGSVSISSVSDNLIISTGLPDSNSFSLSASILTPAGFDYDGFESTMTLRAADAFNNPVPDGTTINFMTEYGRVTDTCTSVGGDCSVTWNSQSPRSPDDISATGIVLNLLNSSCDSDSNGTADVDSQGATVAATPCPVLSVANTDVGNVTGSNFTSVLFDLAGDPDYPGQVFGGRSTILAYAIGEESFVDANGNGMFDSGEAFTDLGEPFVDHNEDGVFGNPNTTGACVSTVNVGTYNCANWQEGGEEEEFVDFNSDGQYTPANGIYNGSLCSDAAELAGDCEKVLVYVSDTLTLNVGGSTPYIGIYDTSNVLQTGVDQNVDVSVAGSTATRRIIISDIFNGRLPAGTTVSATTDNCKLVGLTDYEFVDTSAFGNHAVDFTLTEDTSTDTSFGVVTITVTTPDRAGGVVATTSFNCEDND